MNENKIIKTNISHEIISPIIKAYDDVFISQEIFYKNSSNNYYDYLKKPSKITKYGYVTILFCDSTYLSSILVTGYYLKYILKTKYNIICLVQDRPFYENDIIGDKYIKFPGISKSNISDIKKIYDVVIGINLLNINIEKRSNWNLQSQYKNIPYYCTKLLCLGLEEYSRLIYYDSTTLIIKNIDNIFEEYKYSTYRNDKLLLALKRGFIGNFYLFEPRLYYLYKGIYLTENYNFIFKNIYSLFTKDEDVIYYTVYPHWGYNGEEFVFDDYIFRTNSLRRPYFNTIEKIWNYSIELYVGQKPFLYPLKDENEERNMYNNNNNCYKSWDKVVPLIIKKYPKFNKYFQYIKTFRITDF